MEGGGYQVLLAFCGSGYSIQLAKHELKRVMANNHQLVVGYRVQQKSRSQAIIQPMSDPKVRVGYLPDTINNNRNANAQTLQTTMENQICDPKVRVPYSPDAANYNIKSSD